MEPAYSEVERRRLQQQQQLGVEIGRSVGGSGSVTVPHIPGAVY